MRKSRSLRRSVETRNPKRKFVIFTEGKNTEPEYFRAVGASLAGTLLELEIVDAAGVPLTIANTACGFSKSIMQRKRKSSFEQQDRIWAVFDRDEHPHVEQAIEHCRQSNVGVAFSDPCFEIWLLLHHIDYDSPDDRHHIQKALEKKCPEYDRKRSKTVNYSDFVPRVEDAEKRAEVQLKRRKCEGDPPRRPYTTVYLLTRELRSAEVKGTAVI